MNKRLLTGGLFLLTGCSPTVTQIKHLSPLTQPAQPPATCKIVSVLSDSPAQKSGLQTGEVIVSVNGTKPADAVAVADLIQRAGPDAALEVADPSGKARHVNVTLNKEKPRLGASCDLTGWHKNSVSAAGNEAITVFEGPFALTVSGIVDKGLAFMRVRISNHSDHPLPVSTTLLSVHEPGPTAVPILSPQEVMYFMHGDDGVPLIQPPPSTPVPSPAVPADSVVRRSDHPHKSKADWTSSDENYVQANAKYLNKESFWPATVAPGGVADGLIYFLEPKTLPLTIEARVETHTMAVEFGTPVPSSKRMTADELINFFNAQKKGTAVRLTLTSGKVFVGRYSSYDSLNEIVWFDTPSGVLLTTSSFGLKRIAFAEAISPDTDKKQPPAESIN